ncbi:MAG: TolC family protein, partial [Gemmatimonadetes bacterium]|nr:TolC family protein [Gemmatimonadota bacterium]
MNHRTPTDRYLIGPCVLIAIAGTFFTDVALAQESELTLGQCVSIALEENPLLLSAREQYRASLARISQARAFPQPTLSIDSDMQPSLTDVGGSQERYYGISELIPFPGKTYFRGQVAR